MACAVERARQYYAANATTIKASSARYRANNKGGKRAYDAKYYAENAVELKMKRVDKREGKSAYNAQYRIDNAAEIKAKRAKLETRNARAAREFERYHRDPAFKMAISLRGRLSGAIKGKSKRGSAVKLLGCSVEEVIIYIEKQWTDGMTWENWSRFGWHIDHVLPLSSFDLEDPTQLATVCHYSNLRPLWWHDNLSKGGRVLVVGTVIGDSPRNSRPQPGADL